VPGASDHPGVLHVLPGRVRVHVPGWEGDDPDRLCAWLTRVPGVTAARASPATGNAVVRFDPGQTDAEAIIAALRRRPRRLPATGRRRGVAEPSPAPSEPGRGHGRVVGVPGRRRARIAVRGIERDPRLLRKVLERLERRPDVRRVSGSVVTGRVLVEFSGKVIDLQDLLDDLAVVEAPDTAGEDLPEHPLDPAPLIQSGARLIGSALGLSILAVRRATGRTGALVPTHVPAVAAAVGGVVEGLPPVRAGLERALGRDHAQLLLGGVAIVSLTLSGSPLGLLLNGAAALRLFTEVRARRRAWMEYEERLGGVDSARPGALVRLEAGDRVPLDARVVEGTGTAAGLDGLPRARAPGDTIEAGSRVHGGPLVVELLGKSMGPPPADLAPEPTSPLEPYVNVVASMSMAYALGTLLITRSPGRAVTALLLVNPRPAFIGAESADTGARARVLRSGVVVVGTRPHRAIVRPDRLLLANPRMLGDGYELRHVTPLDEHEDGRLHALALAVAGGAGSPWGPQISAAPPQDTSGRFDGTAATATIDGRGYELRPATAREVPQATLASAARRGEEMLVLRTAEEDRTLATVTLRARLAPGVPELVDLCARLGVDLQVLEAGDPSAATALADRAGVAMVRDADPVRLIDDAHREGLRIAVAADSAGAAAAFEVCDLAIGMSSGRSGPFPARADLLAPDLPAITSVLDAGVRHDQALTASIGLSGAANIAGIWGGARGVRGIEQASLGTYAAALGATAFGWWRLRGGRRPDSLVRGLVDPRPERWGRLSPADALTAVGSTPDGLTHAEATMRRAAPRTARRPSRLLPALAEQLRSPIMYALGAAAGLSLAAGATADVTMIGAAVAANALIGAWQEREADRAAESLRDLAPVRARVLRDGRAIEVPSGDVVAGDVLVLAGGDRVVADARLLADERIEVDEAVLTGESIPVRKVTEGCAEGDRIVLDGSHVIVGTCRAVVVATGTGTRLGATAAALESDATRMSPLARRLHRLLRQAYPFIIGGGLVTTAAGLARGAPLRRQLSVGAGVAVAAVPEGLPLLSRLAEAGVARRLAHRHALVRRLGAVEALGRVDVACCDKTGTLTRGRLAVARLATIDQESRFPADLPRALEEVLLAAALASPAPEAPGASAHPTDVAVVEAAERIGADHRLRGERSEQVPFEPVRSFHAAVVDGRLYVKGSPEALIERCSAVRRRGGVVRLTPAERRRLAARVDELSAEALRVLMVAEGDGSPEDPRDLVAVGFVGIADPLRPGVREAVARCAVAGVRLLMLTGDHPQTARAIARQAGLPVDHGDILTGAEIAALHDDELAPALERVSVIARITPLDKVRIVQSLQRGGHTVAMTGDGVNDAPALRLADVGVAMGRGGSDVARQAADVILTDDDVSTLVETFVEGRVFWQNMRSALALLLGGNLGEVCVMTVASVAGGVNAMTARQVLAVNLLSDVLPSSAIALRGPENRDLSALAREGASALDTPLRAEILQRGAATAVPSLMAYALAARRGRGQTVAFASVVATQLAQTADLGFAGRRFSRPIAGAVAVSVALLGGMLGLPALRAALGLAAPGLLDLALIGGAAMASVVLARAGERSVA
jgi:cation-transporting ATPase I